MTLVFHIGTHKTGTTTIQRFAASCRKELRRRKLWYPSFREAGLSGHYAHHKFAHAVAGETKWGHSLDDAHRFAEFVRANRNKRETVLLSAEPVYRHVLPDTGDYWRGREAYARRLKEVIGTDDVTILAVVRRQDRFAESLYQEKIKAKTYARPFREFLNEERHEFEYHRQLSIFNEVFGKVDVLVFEDLQQGELIDRFFAYLGVDVSDLPRETTRNVSLPLELVEYKRLLNATGARQGRLADVAKKLEDRALSGGLNNDFSWIPRGEMEAFYLSFEEENERLRRSFLPDRSQPLFPSLDAAPIADKSAYRGMSTQRFAELTMEISW